MKVLYMVSKGPNDPTGASVGLHLALNGSLEVGDDVTLVLAGDGADLIRSEIVDAVHGVAVPPLSELFAKVREHEVPVYV